MGERYPIIVTQRAEGFDEALGRLPQSDGGIFEKLRLALWEAIQTHRQGEIIPLERRMVELSGEEMALLERFSFRQGEILFTAYRECLPETSDWLGIFFRSDCDGDYEFPSRREVSRMVPPVEGNGELILVCLETDLTVQRKSSEFVIGFVTKHEWDELGLARRSAV